MQLGPYSQGREAPPHTARPVAVVGVGAGGGGSPPPAKEGRGYNPREIFEILHTKYCNLVNFRTI